MVAWGGSPAAGARTAGSGREARVWFYDVSAGPDYGTANWLLELADIDGDGVADDRIPPIWEYGTTTGTARSTTSPPTSRKLVRFVAVDALFAASPIYDPAISEPLLADGVELDLNIFAGRPGRDPLPRCCASRPAGDFDRLDPTRSFAVDTAVTRSTARSRRRSTASRAAFGTAAAAVLRQRDHVHADPGNPSIDAAVLRPRRVLRRQGRAVPRRHRYEAARGGLRPSRRALAPTRSPASPPHAPNLQGWTYAWATDAGGSIGASTDTGLRRHEVGPPPRALARPRRL